MTIGYLFTVVNIEWNVEVNVEKAVDRIRRHVYQSSPSLGQQEIRPLRAYLGDNLKTTVRTGRHPIPVQEGEETGGSRLTLRSRDQ
jgi:hypothetical protein